jgi:hypothetical protein
MISETIQQQMMNLVHADIWSESDDDKLDESRGRNYPIFSARKDIHDKDAANCGEDSSKTAPRYRDTESNKFVAVVVDGKVTFYGASKKRL